MKFIKYFQKTPLYAAIEKGNLEIVQLLLARPELDINLKSIYFTILNGINYLNF